jgi:two-component system phosphate regulon sensor histidine kinase PhoR
MAEPDFFEMVIMNIVTNAIIYNKGEEAMLKISIDSSPRGNLAIKFSDNGIGLEKSEFKKVFKKMYQVGKTAKGSGLGLYLSSSIMKIHKGKLSVESDGAGYGSSFIITIPVCRDII